MGIRDHVSPEIFRRVFGRPYETLAVKEDVGITHNLFYGEVTDPTRRGIVLIETIRVEQEKFRKRTDYHLGTFLGEGEEEEFLKKAWKVKKRANRVNAGQLEEGIKIRANKLGFPK